MALLVCKECDIGYFSYILVSIHNCSMVLSFYLVHFVHVMHNEVFNDCLVGNTGNHAIHSLTSQIVEIRVLLYFSHALLHSLDNVVHLANVARHDCHVDRFRIGLLLNIEAPLLQGVSQFVATEIFAPEGNDG
jgi:hypothetical protein